MLPRVKGSDFSKLENRSVCDDNDPALWKLFFLQHQVEFFGYLEVVEMPIPEGEDEDTYSKRVRQYVKINRNLMAMIGRACNENSKCQNLLRSYTDVKWAYYYLKYLIKRFKSKG